MKKNVKRIVSLILALCMLSALAVTAFAAAPTKSGMYNVTVGTPYTAAGTEAIKPEANAELGQFYADAERLLVTPTVGTGVHALIFALKQEEGAALVPTKDNIWFIDQKTGTAEFNVFPKTLAQGHYNIWLTTSDGKAAQSLGGFDYYLAYTLGDIDDNSEITATDALYAMQIAVGVGEWTDTQKTIADVDKKSGVTATDALFIMQRAVGVLTSFDFN